MYMFFEKFSNNRLKKLTLTEIKILLWLTDLIRWNISPLHQYVIRLSDLSERMNHKNIKYTELKSTFIQLAETEILVQERSLEFEKRLIENIEIPSRSQVISFKMHAAIEILFLRLAKMFNTDEINLLLKAKSTFTIKLYTLVRDSVWNGDIVTIEELREMLDVHDQYPRYANFKARILVPASEEIKSLLGLSINFIEQKSGNRINSLQIQLSRSISHAHLDINQDYFLDQAKLFTKFIDAKLTPDLYSKWLQKGEYAFIVALDYVQTRIGSIRQPVPYLSKLIETENFGQVINGLRPEEYLLIRGFLDPFRNITSVTPQFVIEKEFRQYCEDNGYERNTLQLWLKAKDKIINDIHGFVSNNRKKKHPNHT